MSDLSGYSKVAVVTLSGRDYMYALYDDNIKVGDDVYLSNGITSTVREIITVEEARVRFRKNIISEVVCKLDMKAYNDRVEKRKEVARIKKEMDKKIKELQERDKYSIYAEKDPELAELLNTYKGLIE